MTTMPQPQSPTGSFTAVYDAWNRLTELKDGAIVVAAYEYDGRNRRIVAEIDTDSDGLFEVTRHDYYTSNWQLLEQREGTTPETADPERQYVWEQQSKQYPPPFLTRGQAGRPRRRPDRLYGDRAYDSQPHRRWLRERGIQPHLARRNTEHGSGLGVYHWVTERTLSWQPQLKRLRTRWERSGWIHEGLLKLSCVPICHRRLRPVS